MPLRFAPPHKRLLPTDLAIGREVRWLGPDRHGRLYAVDDGRGQWHPERPPVVLVHGIWGWPAQFAELAEPLIRAGRHQLYALVYDDARRRVSLHGDELADELLALTEGPIGTGRDWVVLAHSMGGIVTRRALRRLQDDASDIDRFGAVRVQCADTPWHGFAGPGEEDEGAWMLDWVLPMLPDGLDDMRAASSLFRGSPGAARRSDREGLFGPLPERISFELVFAERGGTTRGPAERRQRRKLIRQMRSAGVEDDAAANLWAALRTSSKGAALLRWLGESEVDEDALGTVLDALFPRFPGGHTGMLRAKHGPAGWPHHVADQLLG